MALVDILNHLDDIDTSYHLSIHDNPLLAIPVDEYITKECLDAQG